jgi:prenyltransferase beta subunit
MKRLSIALLLLLAGVGTIRAQTAEEKRATVAYLQQLQQPDGGFRAGAGAQGTTLQATVAAVRALHYFGGEPRDRDPCVRYVESAFDSSTGGFRNTQPDGKPDVPVTAVGLMCLAALKLPADRYADPAVKFLEEHAKAFEEVRMAAAGLEAAGKESQRAQAWLQQVARMRNADGSYGKGEGTARATGSAVVTVLRLGGKPDDVKRVLEVLRAGQRKDGGWGKEEAAGSDLETTYRVMRCFHMLKEQPDTSACRAFLGRCRNGDGGYGVAPGQPSGVSGTYFAGSVLHWLAEE